MILHPAHDHVRVAVLASLDTETRAGWHEALARAFEAVQGAGAARLAGRRRALARRGPPGERRAPRGRRGARAPRRRSRSGARPSSTRSRSRTARGTPPGQRDLLRRKAHALRVRRPARRGRRGLRPRRAAPARRRGDRSRAAARRGAAAARPARRGAARRREAARARSASASRSRRARRARGSRRSGCRRSCAGSTSSSATPPTIPRADAARDRRAVLDRERPRVRGSGARPRRAVRARCARRSTPASRCACASRSSQEVCYAAAGGQPQPRGRRGGRRAAQGDRDRGSAHPHVIGFADTAIGIAAHMSGRWRDARGHLEAGLATLRDHGAGVRWEIDIGDTYWLATLFYLGEWREMARLTPARSCATRSSAATSSRSRACAPGRCNLAWLIARPARRGARAARDRGARARRRLPPAARAGGRSRRQHRALRRRRRGAAQRLERRVADHRAASAACGCSSRASSSRCCARASRSPTLDAARGRAARAIARTIADELIKEGAGWAPGSATSCVPRCTRGTRDDAPRASSCSRPRSTSSRPGMIGLVAGRAVAPRRARRRRRRDRARGGGA